MAKMLGDLTDKEIRAMIKNYDAAGKIAGGNWSRAELMLELDRRKPTIYAPRDLAMKIHTLCRHSPDQRVSYGAVWLAYHPAPLPKGHGWRKRVTDGLAVLGAWCVDNDLPILSTLVVNNETRELTDAACANVWNYIKAIKNDTSLTARDFVDEQAKLAMEMPIAEIVKKSGDGSDIAAA